MVTTFQPTDLPERVFSGKPTDEIDLSICLVNWNTRRLLYDCIESIQKNRDDLSIEVFVVDNASADHSAEMVRREFPWVQVIENRENVGFARANNQGVALSHGRNVLLLNPDTIVLPGALKVMVEFLDSNPTTGAVAAKLFNSDGSLQYSVRRFPTYLTPFTENSDLFNVGFMRKFAEKSRMMDWPHETIREVEQPAGAAFMIKKVVFETLGDLDNSYHMFFEDVELCYRIWKNGWKIYYLPSARIIHYGGQSVQQRQNVGEEFYRSLIHYFRNHYGPRGELKVRTAMIFGALAYTLYAFGVAFLHLDQANLIARSAFQVFRFGFRFRDNSGSNPVLMSESDGGQGK